MAENVEKLILIVEDQESDVKILTRLLRNLGVQNPVHRVADGHEALRFLNGDAPFDDRSKYPFPAIVFLDLKIPVVSGFDVLDWIRAICSKRDCHVFIYSEFVNVSEVRKVYLMGASSFLRKPAQELELMNLIYHFPKNWEIDRNKAGAET